VGANSDLWFCEDGNAAQGIPITPATVIMTDIYDSGDYTFHVRPLIRQHKLAKINHRAGFRNLNIGISGVSA
jgi:hypothetical protein